MRSKMLGVAIALSTFGLGIAATTVWIAHNTPPVPQEIVTSRIVFVPHELPATTEPLAPCDARSAPKAPASGTRAVETTIYGGVLNGKAVSKPAPAYPPIAREARAMGVVIVEVKVDECGNVVSARPVSGHPLLQQAAAQAAYQWRFTPTRLSGQPVAVLGTVTFDFMLQ